VGGEGGEGLLYYKTGFAGRGSRRARRRRPGRKEGLEGSSDQEGNLFFLEGRRLKTHPWRKKVIVLLEDDPSRDQGGLEKNEKLASQNRKNGPRTEFHVSRERGGKWGASSEEGPPAEEENAKSPRRRGGKGSFYSRISGKSPEKDELGKRLSR